MRNRYLQHRHIENIILYGSSCRQTDRKTIQETHLCMPLKPVFTRKNESGLQITIRFGGAKRREFSAPLWKAIISPVRQLYRSVPPAAVEWVPVQKILKAWQAEQHGSPVHDWTAAHPAVLLLNGLTDLDLISLYSKYITECEMSRTLSFVQ